MLLRVSISEMTKGCEHIEQFMLYIVCGSREALNNRDYVLTCTFLGRKTNVILRCLGGSSSFMGVEQLIVC